MTDVHNYSPPPPTVPPPPPPPVVAEDLRGEDPAPPPRARRRRGPRSLTSKLVIGVVSLVIVLVAIIGASTYLRLRSFLDQRLDEQVASTAAQNFGFFRHCVLQATSSCGPGPQSQEEWVIAVDPDSGGYETFKSAYGSELHALTLTAAQRQQLSAARGVFTVQLGNQVLRVKAVQGSGQDGQLPNLIVATGLSTDDVNRTLRQLVLLELVIGGAAVVIAVIATTSGVRFSLRRLRRVTVTAQDVAAELSPEGAGLDRRVPDDEPDTEVGQLATSFNTMLAAVEAQFHARIESEERMRQFMADASHELRTPLTSIRGYAELARMQRAVGEGHDDNLDRIEFEGTRMSRLVEDLLLLARGDAEESADRPVTRELVEIPDVIDDAVNGVRAAFPERVITVDGGSNIHVVGDPDQLLRVIRNLVTNAAVHTAADRPIRVHSHADADDSGVTIQIIDGGPGLAPEDAAHVFERFWRADKARTRARGGSGLGMSIVASIIRAHGGAVRFDSSVEAGSTVTVWLPGVQSD